MYRRDKIDSVLTAIVDSLISHQAKKIRTHNLLGDKSGTALFMFYMYKYTENGEYYQKATDILEEVIDIHASNDMIPTSISKFGWLLNHLNKHNFIEANTDECFKNMDMDLSEFMINSLVKDNYDFLHGSLGIVLYFLSKKKFVYWFKTIPNSFY